MPVELIVVVANLSAWMANSSPTWAAYLYLMECCLIALDNCPGACSIGIGDKTRCTITTLVMRAAGDQVKTACGILQLCAGLEACIEGATHTVALRRRDRNTPATVYSTDE